MRHIVHGMSMAAVQLSWLRIQASNQKVAKLRFDSRCGSASLCPWERHLMLFPILGPSNLCWSGMTDTEHSTTSSSNNKKMA